MSNSKLLTSIDIDLCCQKVFFTFKLCNRLHALYLTTHTSLPPPPDGRPGSGLAHDLLRARASDRLHQALHEHGNQHSVQEAREAEPQSLLLPVASQLGRVVLRAGGVYDSQLRPLRRLQVSRAGFGGITESVGVSSGTARVRLTYGITNGNVV